MMSVHGANPVIFNKSNNNWTSRTLAKPPPPTSDHISFLPYTIHPPQSGRHICITPIAILYYI